MPVVYSALAKNARFSSVLTLIDANGAPGLRLLNATNQTIAVVTLANPAATINSGVMTFVTPVSCPLVQAGGVITSGDIEDGVGNVVISGLTVGNSTAFDITMSNTTVSSGQVITLTFAQIIGS